MIQLKLDSIDDTAIIRLLWNFVDSRLKSWIHRAHEGSVWDRGRRVKALLWIQLGECIGDPPM